MGNRANFGFTDRNDNTIYLYGHWAGEGMMNTLAAAIEKVVDCGRENDESYATRIAISQIIGKAWDVELGWGLSVNEIGDNEHSVPVVNWKMGNVTLWDYEMQNVKCVWALSEFIERFLKVGAAV